VVCARHPAASLFALSTLNLLSFYAILVGGKHHNNLGKTALPMAEPAPFLLEHTRAEQRPTVAQDGREEDGQGADGPTAIGVSASAFLSF
jgi:hypothetical protein